MTECPIEEKHCDSRSHVTSPSHLRADNVKPPTKGSDLREVNSIVRYWNMTFMRPAIQFSALNPCYGTIERNTHKKVWGFWKGKKKKAKYNARTHTHALAETGYLPITFFMVTFLVFFATFSFLNKYFKVDCRLQCWLGKTRAFRPGSYRTKAATMSHTRT